MNLIPALFVVSCCITSMGYAAEISSSSDDYIWQERFAQRLKLANTGIAEAQFNIGEMYEKGSGIPSNTYSAFIWFELAAKQNHQKAQFKVAYMYYRGEGVPANPAKAFQLMASLAKNSYVRAQFYVGLMHETGSGTPRDMAQAQLWYSRAAKGGNTTAAEILADTKRFPAQLVQSETVRTEPISQPPKNLPDVKRTPTQASAPLAPNTSPIILNSPLANMSPITEALRSEVTRGAQIALGGERPERLDMFPAPPTSVAGLHPAIQMNPTPYSALAKGNWVSQANLPVEFLPSQLTACELSNDGAIACVSKYLVRTIGESEIGYQTLATVYAAHSTGDFKITYRNNIVKITRRSDSKNATEPGSADKNIKLGLQETEHRLDCKFENERTIQCVKNQTQKMTITNSTAL